MDHFSASAVIIEEAKKNAKIKMFTGIETKRFVVGKRRKLEAVICFDRALIIKRSFLTLMAYLCMSD